MKTTFVQRLLVLCVLVAPACSSCKSEDSTPIEVPEGQVLPGTIVDIDLDNPDDPGRLPTLEPAISAKETRDIVDNFSWADTAELAENDDDGDIAVHYAMIYVSTPAQRENLQYLEPLWSPVPLFAAEREKWAGKTGALPGTGDGRGVFVFALLPAKVYNVLRDAGISGKPIFEPVVLRDPPDEVPRNDSGSVNRDYLFENGFLYTPEAETQTQTQALVTRQQKLIPPTVVRHLAEAAQATIDGLRVGATKFLAWFHSKTWVIESDVLDVDPRFDGARADGSLVAGAEPLMERQWRSAPDNASVPLKLAGVKVRLQSGVALALARFDDGGRAVTDAWSGRHGTVSYDVCFDMVSPAALITDFVLPVTVCSFGPSARAVRGGDGTVVSARVQAKDYRTNMMAQFIDGRAYATEILGITPRQARVMIGGFANAIGNIQPVPRAFTMCNGQATWLSGVYIGLLEGINALALAIPIPGLDIVTLAVTTLISTVLANDIFFPNAGNGTTDDDAPVSRGVPTHEYGHFVMCNAMARVSTEHLSTAWGDIVRSTLFDGDTGNPDNDNLYVNEAWADFFAYQVVGGTNYFGWSAPLETASRGVNYCAQTAFDASGTRTERDPAQTCLDENSGAAGLGTTFRDRAQRIAAIFQDAFDGARLTAEGFASSDLYPMSDVGWKEVEGEFTRSDGWRFPPDDESIVLPGTALRDVMANWGAYNLALGEAPMLDALVRTFRDYGYSEAEICQFFALHSPDGDCTTLVDTVDVGSIIPSTPLRLDFRLALNNDAAFTWEDASVVNTGFHWELTSDSDTRSGDVGADTTELTFTDLQPETRYTFELWTVNGENRSRGSRRVQLTTYPEAPMFTNVVAAPGGGYAEWTGTSASYVVEYRLPGEEFREYAATSDLALDLDGLRPNTTYELRVIGVGISGQRGPSSDVRTLTTLPVVEVWVDPAGLDTGTGTQADPVATFAEALARADADPTIDAIVLTNTAHAQPDFVHITRDLTIRGDGPLAELDVAGTSPAQGCLPPAGLDRISPEVAVLVAPGTRVTIDNLTIRATNAPTSTNCFGVMASVADYLRLSDVNLELGDDPTATGCMLGLSVTDGTQATLSGTHMNLAGATSGVSNLVGYGMCASGMTAVSVFDSDVQLGAGTDLDGLSFDTAIGMSVESVQSLRVSRSRIQLSEGTTDATADAAYGVYGSVRGSVFFDNSLIRTLNGGRLNDAINLSAPPLLLPSYTLAFVTAIAGFDDTSANLQADDNLMSAALRLSGLVSRLTTYDSLYAQAAGWGTNARRHGIDLSGVSGRICNVQARNNAMQVAAYTVDRVGKSAANIYISDAEFSNFLYDLDWSGAWNAFGCTTPSLDIADNFGMAIPNNSFGTGGDTPQRVVDFDPDGQVAAPVDGANTWFRSRDHVRSAGLPYSSLPVGGADVDLDSVARGTSQTAIGAYEYAP